MKKVGWRRPPVIADDEGVEPDIAYVLRRLEQMRSAGIWPNGLRYLWTDAFGLLLLLSLHRRTAEARWLEEAEALAAEVDRVLGRPRGYRIGEEADRDGQYFHYLSMWMFALWRFGQVRGEYQQRAVDLVRQVHEPFVLRGVGVHWKMLEDLSAPYPGYGLGALDAFDGFMAYSLINASEGGDPLAREIADMRQLIERQYRRLHIDQDLGLGMMLWMCAWCPEEPWAQPVREQSLKTLESMWRPAEPDHLGERGYFARHPQSRQERYAFTNYGVSIGLQAAGAWPGRVAALHRYFETYRSGDEYDTNAITHVMGCCAHLPGLLLPP